MLLVSASHLAQGEHFLSQRSEKHLAYCSAPMHNHFPAQEKSVFFPGINAYCVHGSQLSDQIQEERMV
jgi:hypothetical protein